MPEKWAPKEGVRFVKNLIIPMSDGVRLAADLHLPEGEGPFPLVLEYIPYRKDDTTPYTGHHHYFARHGIIGCRIDCRGTGSSEGTTSDEYRLVEQRDAVEAIQWLASQPFCDGNIAMFGSSYGGFTALQVACHQPPALKTIVPLYFTDDRYTDDCHYRGGCFRCYYDIGSYGAWMIGMNASPPYPEYSGDDWGRLWEEHLEGNTPYLLEWLSHQTDGEYWRCGSVRQNLDKNAPPAGYERIRIPVFMIGGWRDGYPNPPWRLFQHLQVPKKLLIGPWNHTPPDRAIPGPRVDYLAEVVRWLDYWLKGRDTGIMEEPPVCLYVQTYDDPKADRLDTSGYWRLEQSVPPEGAQERSFFFGRGGTLNETAPPDESSEEYEYRPTVGLRGGLWSGGVPFGLPTDQRPDEIYSLNYTTEPLEEPLEIIGIPQAVLHVSSTATVMAFVVRLCDVAPDGKSALVCNGVLNATRRNSLVHPEPLIPGEVYEIVVPLDTTAWRFEKGHRIRVSVCSSDFPNLWPTPYPGRNRLYVGGERLSRLFLPVVPSAEPTTPPFGLSSVSVSVYDSPLDAPAWQIVEDVLNDRVCLKLYSLELWASNRNPAEVSATGKHSRHFSRPGMEVHVETNTTLRSTEEAFHLAIELHVTLNGFPHFQRRWVRSFPRILL